MLDSSSVGRENNASGGYRRMIRRIFRTNVIARRYTLLLLGFQRAHFIPRHSWRRKRYQLAIFEQRRSVLVVHDKVPNFSSLPYALIGGGCYWSIGKFSRFGT